MPSVLKTPTPLDDSLYVGFIHSPLVVLGPGVRVGLWLSGCSKHCPGCLAPDLWDQNEHQKISLNDLVKTILDLGVLNQTKALTISGGEPFEQATALLGLLEKLRLSGMDDILVYSGFFKEDLVARYPSLPSLVSALVDGPFENSNPSKEIFRGSFGQKLYIFDQTLGQIYRPWSTQTQRKVQMLLSDEQMRLLGIPGLGDYEPLAEAIKAGQTNN